MEEKNTNEVENLLKNLKDIKAVLTPEALEEATNEQLLEYIELTNQIQAIILSSMAMGEE